MTNSHTTAMYGCDGLYNMLHAVDNTSMCRLDVETRELCDLVSRGPLPKLHETFVPHNKSALCNVGPLVNTKFLRVCGVVNLKQW